ncbi:MAG: membrane protein insertase YidC [Nitrospirota bacterium]
MEKNLIIAIVLSVAILVGYNYMFPPFKAAPVKAPSAASPLKPQESQGQQAPQGQSPAPASAPSPVVSLSQVSGALIKDIPVDTSLYSAVITTQGGTIKSFKLLDKKYQNAQGRPLEMVPPGEQIMPLALVPTGATSAQAQGVIYTADKDALTLTKGGEGTLTLTAQGTDGKALTKTLTFKDGSYVIDGSFEAKGYPSAVMYMGDGFGSLTDLKEMTRFNYAQVFTLMDGSKHENNPAKLETEKTYSGKTGWTGITDKYFIAAVVPSGPFKAIVGKGSLDTGITGVQSAGPSEKFSLYIGPKEYDRLKAADHELERSVDYGWFAFIAKPLFVALKFFHGLVGNWGWAIVVLTVVIKLLFAPLTHKSQKSMKRMQKLQPLFAELKEKHKGDPARLNKEMMELYKKHKVNPMGGCLPMLIQIPVFIALYRVLGNSIELRHAPFIFWLHDLSAKDPYYVLPIVMGGSMLLMQKMTPTSMDPKQNMIMMLMPVIMTFMFINLPSGLVLYFTVSNLLSMAQQLYINKYSSDTVIE